MATISLSQPRIDAPGRHSWLVAALALVLGAAGAGYGLAVGELEALWVGLAAAACVAILVDFRVGAILVVLLLPISSTVFFPRELLGITGLNPLNLILVGTLGAYLLRGRAEHGAAFVPPRLLWLYIVPIAVAALIGCLRVDDIYPEYHERLVIYFTDWKGYLRDLFVKPMLIVLAALLVSAAVAKARKAEPYVFALAAGACALAFVMFGFIIASEIPRLGMLASSGARRFFSEIGAHANQLGRVLVTAYALLLFTWWETKHAATRVTLFAVLGILCLAIMLTFSRNAYLGSLLVSALFVMWKFNARKFALGLGATAVAIALMPAAVYRRISHGFDSGSADAVSAGRIEGIWQPLLPDAFDTPIFGEGLNSIMWSEAIVHRTMDFIGHPHNAYLQAVLDMGFVGLVLLVAYYVHTWKNFRALGSNPYLTPTMRGFCQGGCAALLAFAVACVTGGSLRPEPENALLWIAIGIMYGLLARRPGS